MSFQTGTIANINDVLDVLATFLAANGWTIDGNWLEPVFVRSQIVAPSPPNPAEKWWRYGRRLHAHKGDVYISAQDFFYTYHLAYGTINNFGLVGALQGPGIALTVSSSFNAYDLGNQAAHPLSDYDTNGPANPSFHQQPGIPVNGANTPRTFIMTLPDLVSQPLGRWYQPLHIMDATSALSNPGGDPLLPGPFGAIGGAAKPMQYWLICDATGDNVIMVVDRTGVDYSWIPNSPYLYFGDMSATKAGAWTGGVYAGASHGNNGTYDLVLNEYNHCTRFAPPGALRDGGSCPAVVRMDVDSWVGNWVGLVGVYNDGSVSTGRSFSSTTVLDPKPTDFSQNPLGLPDLGCLPMTLRRRLSTIANGAVCLPTHWWVKRDSGLWSSVGFLPNVYQAKTKGMSLGVQDTETPSTIYFDGYAVVITDP